jgi:hypothetical protein
VARRDNLPIEIGLFNRARRFNNGREHVRRIDRYLSAGQAIRHAAKKRRVIE